MAQEKLSPYAHLLLGLTKQELARRVALGLINPEILKAQLDQNARDLKLEALCERHIELQSLSQVDKYDASE